MSMWKVLKRVFCRRWLEDRGDKNAKKMIIIDDQVLRKCRGVSRKTREITDKHRGLCWTVA